MFITFGLCAAVCCAGANTSPIARASSPEHSHGGHSVNHESSPKPAAKKHCHTESEPTQPEQAKEKDEHPVLANNSHHGHGQKQPASFSTAAASLKLCACGEANQPTIELSQSIISSNVKQAVIDCSPSRYCGEEALPPRLALRHAFRPHSPPDGGLKLNLRI
ncbi:MAG: hypothetical protein ABIU20_01425 [Blastocatellia bacterium]